MPGKSIQSQTVWKEQGSSSRSPPADHPAGLGFVAWVEGLCAWLAVLACLSGVWCGNGVTQIQFKIVLKKFVQFSSSA